MDIVKHLSEVVVFQLITIAVATWLGIILTSPVLSWAARKFSGAYRLYILASIPPLRLIILIAGVTLIVPLIIEPTLENLIGLFGALGLALGFAFKDYISSLVAGILTLYEMPYRIGDWVRIEGAYGEVKAIGMRALEIVTPEDTVVIIPHLKLWSAPVFNANDGSQNLLCVADFYLHPRHDGSAVVNTLYDVGLTSAFLKTEQPLSVVVKEEPGCTHYRLKAYPVAPADQFRFTSDLTVRGKAALSNLGVEFANLFTPQGEI